MSITLHFLGHSAWQIRTGEYDILIDPFITGNPVAPVKAEDLHPTHIIVTHAHGDHWGDTEALARRTGATVISSFEIASYAESHGCKAWGMATGGSHAFEFGRVRLTPALHGSVFPDGTNGGVASGVLISIGRTNIYHAGDTALFSDMKLLSERFSIDVAMLPIGDNYTMDVTDAVRAAGFLQPALSIPMHYNTFPAIAADPEAFRAGLEAIGLRARTMNPGDEYPLHPTT